MVTMNQRAQLHRILDNCILLINQGDAVTFKMNNDRLAVECKDPKKDFKSIFTNTSFDSPMNFNDLLVIAEQLEKEMGVEI